MPFNLKFITTPHRLLIGTDTHHHHLLTQEYGENIFPAETLAIGTGIFKGNEIVGIGFDYGTPEDRATTVDRIRIWAQQSGYDMARDLYDIYAKEAKIYKQADKVVSAFLWDGEKIHIGQNHSIIIEGLYEDYIGYGELPEKSIMGWIFVDNGEYRADVYSDFYSQDYDEEETGKAIQALRKRWPITEITYGPDSTAIREMEEFFGPMEKIDPRMAALNYIDKVVSL